MLLENKEHSMDISMYEKPFRLVGHCLISTVVEILEIVWFPMGFRNHQLVQVLFLTISIRHVHLEPPPVAVLSPTGGSSLSHHIYATISRISTHAEDIPPPQESPYLYCFLSPTIPIGSMYGIYANIGGILMVNVTIYTIHAGSYGIVWDCFFLIYSWKSL